MTRAWMSLPLFVLATFGCSSSPEKPAFDHLVYSEVSLAPGTAELEPNSVSVAEGIVVKARVTAIDEDGNTMRGGLDLRSLDSSVLEVTPGPEGSFVFIGAGDGETSLSVVFGDRAVGQVAARVLPQP